METREQLLRNLRSVKTQLSKILSVTQQQVRIVAQFRETEAAIATSGVKGLSSMVFLVIGVVVALFAALGQSWTMVWAMAICLAIFFFKRGQKSKLKTAATLFWGLFAVAFVWDTIKSILRGNYVLLVLFLIALVISIVAVRFAVKAENAAIQKRNDQVNQSNAALQDQYLDTVQQLNALRRDLAAFGDGWFPRDYYSLEAVNFFISAIENFKADSMKEAVLLLDNTKYRQKMMESQQRIEQMNQQQLINQNVMNAQLAFANVLNMKNLDLNQQNLNVNRQNLNAVRENTAAVNNAHREHMDFLRNHIK